MQKQALSYSFNRPEDSRRKAIEETNERKIDFTFDRDGNAKEDRNERKIRLNRLILANRSRDETGEDRRGSSDDLIECQADVEKGKIAQND